MRGGRLVGAGLIAAIIVCGGAAPGPKATAKGAETASQPAAPRPPKPYVYPYDCARPVSAQQDNLCIERRQAETADKWDRLTFRALLAIAVGLFLLALATAVAAWALARSASAAEKSARLAERAIARAAARTDAEPKPSAARSRPRPPPLA